MRRIARCVKRPHLLQRQRTHRLFTATIRFRIARTGRVDRLRDGFIRQRPRLAALLQQIGHALGTQPLEFVVGQRWLSEHARQHVDRFRQMRRERGELHDARIPVRAGVERTAHQFNRLRQGRAGEIAGALGEQAGGELRNAFLICRIGRGSGVYQRQNGHQWQLSHRCNDHSQTARQCVRRELRKGVGAGRAGSRAQRCVDGRHAAAS